MEIIQTSFFSTDANSDAAAAVNEFCQASSKPNKVELSDFNWSLQGDCLGRTVRGRPRRRAWTCRAWTHSSRLKLGLASYEQSGQFGSGLKRRDAASCYDIC